MKKGIDVSSNNGLVNWQEIKNSGYEFAIIRLGYGNNEARQDDSQFLNNVKGCENIGMPYGVYLYSYALNLDDANSEVEHALRLLKNVGSNFKYGVWFDMEDADNYKANHGMPSNETLVNICDTFCSKLESNGYYTGIYASLSWLNGSISSNKLDRYDKWVAQWSSQCTYGKSYSMWQYTDKEVIGGKRFDCNYLIKEFNGNKVDGGSTNVEPVHNSNVNVTYRVRTQKHGWLSEVVNLNDYAGYQGSPITGLAIKVDRGSIKYRVTTISGKTLGWITQYNINDKINGYAGNGESIATIEVEYYTPDDIRPYKFAKYKVNNYGWQIDLKKDKSRGLDGYAGSKKTVATKFQITIE